MSRTRAGLSLLEALVALAILAFVLQASLGGFSSGRLSHAESAAHLGRAEIAATIVDLLRDRSLANPNFLRKINNLVVDPGRFAGMLVPPDATFADDVGGAGYAFAARSVPLVERRAGGDAALFGLARAPLDGGGGEPRLLGAPPLDRLRFDLEISDDPAAEPAGILKNARVTLRAPEGVPGEDSRPFVYAAKLLCPPESLSTPAYLNLWARARGGETGEGGAPAGDLAALAARTSEVDALLAAARADPADPVARALARDIATAFVIAEFVASSAANPVLAAEGAGAPADARARADRALLAARVAADAIDALGLLLEGPRAAKTAPGTVLIPALSGAAGGPARTLARAMLALHPGCASVRPGETIGTRIASGLAAAPVLLVENVRAAAGALATLAGGENGEGARLPPRKELETLRELFACRRLALVLDFARRERSLAGRLGNRALETAARVGATARSLLDRFRRRGYDFARDYVEDEERLAANVSHLCRARLRPLADRFGAALARADAFPRLALPGASRGRE